VGPIAIGDVLEGYVGTKKLLHCEVKLGFCKRTKLSKIKGVSSFFGYIPKNRYTCTCVNTLLKTNKFYKIMIRNFIRDFLYCFKAFNLYKGSFGAKMTVFFTLFRLMFKKKLFQKKNKEVSDSFFGYKMTGYDYFTLEFLFKEVFISNEYDFDAKGNKQPLIIDCGANIGASLCFFKKLYPDSKIIVKFNQERLSIQEFTKVNDETSIDKLVIIIRII
jgi:hypothetical protein